MTAYERGDVVEAGDPFNEDNHSRPFMLINTDTHPFDGNQYIALTLTTRTWYEETLEITDSDFIEGGVPAESFIVPWGVSSPVHDDILNWFGRLEQDAVDDAATQLYDYIIR